jgi:hypothetical protein
MAKRLDLTHPWALGFVALGALATACVSTTPVTYRPGRPASPAIGPVGEAISGPPRFIEASPMSCVPFARSRSRIMLQGDANLWWAEGAAEGYPEAHRPQPGSILVLRIGENGARGHLAYVKRVESSREIYVDHANWHGRMEVAVDVPVIDVSPANDWSEVRVFWVDSHQMGARIYPVEGFILPRGAPAA